jgi:hypothetical protein
MLEIKLDGLENIEHTVTEMMHVLKKFGNEDIPNEFFNWEGESLHRRSPWVKRIGRRKSYITFVRPHSAASMKMRHRTMIRARRRHKTLMRGTTRPILRPSLFSDLVQRMTALMERTIRWP